ncbi:MAG: PilN domain-containing protein [Fimbriimonadaceae bacterium]
MPLINLIREQRQEVKRSEGKARLFFMGFAASVLVGVGSFGFLLFLTDRAHGEKADLETHAQKLEPFLTRIKNTDDEYSKVSPRVETLTAARELTDKWNRLMDHLTVQTPDRVWLSTLRAVATDPKKPIQITFGGLSQQQQLIGEFQLRLQGDPDLESVNFKFSQEKPVAAGHLLEFQIEAALKDTAEEKERNEGKEEK